MKFNVLADMPENVNFADGRQEDKLQHKKWKIPFLLVYTILQPGTPKSHCMQSAPVSRLASLFERTRARTKNEG